MPVNMRAASDADRIFRRVPSTPWDWPGARWWRCDLHLHTPASHDFQDPTASAEDWVEAALAAGLDVVAITDHDQAGFVGEARAAAGDRLAVLAGVELTSSEGVHLLVLLGDDGDGDEDSIRSLLGACGVPATDWGLGRARATEPLLRCIEIAAGAPHHGLCIAAHADSEVSERNPSTASLLRAALDPRTLRFVLGSPDLAAVEVWGDDEDEHRQLRGLKPEPGLRRVPGLPLVRFSDAHALAEIGRRSTWIKMTRPTQEGLRLALCDGNHSVRPVVQGEDANAAPSWVIESLRVEQAKLVGRSAPLEIVFNPWLTTLIGGRGSGKTSVLNLLRVALERTDAAGDVAVTLERFLQVGGRDHDGALTPDTKVSAIYRKDGVRFRATWATDDPAPTLEQEQGGAWVAAEGSVATRLPAQILGQGEVHETARQPRALLGIVDRAPAVSRAEWQQGFGAEVARFLALRAHMRQVETTLARESDTRGELDDVRRSLEVFSSDEHRDALTTYQRRYAQEQAVERFVAQAREAVRGLADTATELAPELDDAAFATTDASDGAIRSLAIKATNAVGAALAAAGQAATAADAAIDTFVADADGSAWKLAARAAHDAYSGLVADLQAAGVDDPQRYGELVQRQETLEQRLEELADQQTEADALRGQADESLAHATSLREEISDRREGFLTDLLRDNPLVRVDVERLGDVEGIRSDLRQLLGIEVSFEQDFDRLAEVLRAGTDPVGERLKNLKQRIRAIAEGDASIEVADNRFRTRLEQLNAETLDRLDTWFPEDRLVPSYSRGDGRFEALSRGSAGQQNAAILAFLLSHGSEPIVIDQPESDLDNRLITGLVVAQLRQIKPRRQVILVTHNPNVVVNADAELVAALDLPAGEVLVNASGGLQEDRVRTVVCEIMEGGREAFEARYSRIGERTTARRP
ncbi:MAG: AAA family ATPase [Solirubrobacteraceae bacterium]|nr:AAA family ATPase [Solirubrobacteraceae bacterium]